MAPLLAATFAQLMSTRGCCRRKTAGFSQKDSRRWKKQPEPEGGRQRRPAVRGQDALSSIPWRLRLRRSRLAADPARRQVPPPLEAAGEDEEIHWTP